MEFVTWFKDRHSEIPLRGADAVLKLHLEGATVPFISRYRKEQTGNLDEVQIQRVIDAKEEWDTLLKRQAFILEEIESQKKLTPELREKISKTFDLHHLEDLYLPYKQKRKTKAALAREAGLAPLFEWIWSIGHAQSTPATDDTLHSRALAYVNLEKGITTAEEALEGAQHLVIERLSELQELRKFVRTTVFEKAHLLTAKGEKAKPNSKFEGYFKYSESVPSLLEPQNSHRYLALRRGWMEGELTLSIGGAPSSDGGDGGFEQVLLSRFEDEACKKRDSLAAPLLLKAARLALKAHVIPSIENEVHKALKESADKVAIQVFSENVRKLLLASPFGPKTVLGVDPGVRTGCKLALVHASGQYMASTVMHLQTEAGKTEAKTILGEVCKTVGLQGIAIGNGTASRETETFVRATLKELGHPDTPVAVVSEAGASVYSASDVAREEFPNLDVTVRGAISIARRLQDPLAELVKVDPKSIGVGQYQHDVNENALKKSLDSVVESCVNQVGVNLNTASRHLLAHVSGLGPAVSKSIVEHRAKHGLFKSRTELLNVPRFTQKAFEQAAGFLRIPEAENPLDNTGVHPERYSVLEARARALGCKLSDLLGDGALKLKQDTEFVAQVGEFTAHDIFDELAQPGRDPRETFVPFAFREDIHEVKDLKPDMICPGIVTNVTNFGAFVDIGVHQDGLVHLSQLSHKYIKDPREVVSPGDHVSVKVMEVNFEKNQIALSIKATQQAPAHAPREPREKRKPSPQKQRRELPESPKGTRSAPIPFAEKPKANLSAPVRREIPKMKPPKPRPEATPFNNAFAGLGALKDQLKKS
jgi:uncharacterized protein